MYTPEDDAYLGRTVLEKNLVSREALIECLFRIAQDRKAGARPGYSRPLGVVLVERGLLTEEELNGLLAARVSGGEDRSLGEAEVGRLLVAAGLVQQADIDGCIKAQQEMRAAGAAPPRLGQLVVERGLATEQQVMRALAYQKRTIFSCSGCGVRVSALPPPPGSRYRCKKCGGSLEAGEKHTTGRRLAMREAAHGEDTQFEIDRAVAAYLKQRGMVRRDQLRECQRLQMEFGRYGLVVPLAELLRRSGSLSWQQQQELERVDFSKIVRQADWRSQTVPGYKLLRRLASGGFATIYSAEAVFGGVQVAVKVLHPERAKDARAVVRFQQEAALMRKFDCPWIVRGIEYASERGIHHLVMEYVEGRTLGQAISDSGAFPLRNALHATRQVAEALKYLHREGYLHRDVKPDNALIDDEGNVKLCDLGFAALIPTAAVEGARSPTVVGTEGYRPPEAQRAEAYVKVGVDIYALGILLYALLTGHEPFAGASSEEVVADQIDSGMPVPNLLLVQAPLDVMQFLKRTMHPDREKRFASVVDVLAALDKLTS